MENNKGAVVEMASLRHCSQQCTWSIGHDRAIIAAVDGDCHIVSADATTGVGDAHGVGERDALALAENVEIEVAGAVGPADGARGGKT
jgi:hypothetical protein